LCVLAVITAGSLAFAAPPLHAQPLGLAFSQSATGETIIANIPTEGAASAAGLRDGDRLIEIGDDNAPTPASAAASIRAAQAAGRSAINLIVSRAGRLYYVALLLRR
jgi:membrane-associated protease RseP (regulator of RpoE activity)